MYDDNNSSNSSNNGNKGKFSDRLKKMRRDRLNKKKKVNPKDDNFIINFGRNVLKIALALPLMVYDNVVNLGKGNLGKDNITRDDIDDEMSLISDINQTNSLDRISEKKRLKVNKIKTKNVSLTEEMNKLHLTSLENKENDKIKETTDTKKKTKETNVCIDNVSNKKTVSYNHNKKEVNSQDTRASNLVGEIVKIQKADGREETKKLELGREKDKIEKLQKEIIDLIKKKLVKNINELEILQSELYVLSELNNNDTYLTECKENIKEIKKLLSKVKSLKEKYDYLKDNVDFDYMLERDDESLIDKILELKEICSSEDIKYVVDNYKILNEYKYLYIKIDKLEEESIKYEKYKSDEVLKLKERDIDFDILKDKVYDVDKEKEKYDSFVKKQECFLRDLEGKIAQVDSHEKVTYKLKGFNQLLGSSFKYLGLLLVNPLKGLIPGIATQTVVTKNLIHNLYDNLGWEENRKMVYEAIDYSDSISIAINSLDNTSLMINSTLENISELKNKYVREFGKYEATLPYYKDTIKKIYKMENAILGSKVKVDLLKKRMKDKEKQNDSKMKLVKKLNSSTNN